MEHFNSWKAALFNKQLSKDLAQFPWVLNTQGDKEIT